MAGRSLTACSCHSAFCVRRFDLARRPLLEPGRPYFGRQQTGRPPQTPERIALSDRRRGPVGARLSRPRPAVHSTEHQLPQCGLSGDATASQVGVQGSRPGCRAPRPAMRHHLVGYTRQLQTTASVKAKRSCEFFSARWVVTAIEGRLATHPLPVAHSMGGCRPGHLWARKAYGKARCKVRHPGPVRVCHCRASHIRPRVVCRGDSVPHTVPLV